jgi:hypothetical protein
VTGKGDQTTPDWQIRDATHVDLRAERTLPEACKSPPQDPVRIYTVQVTCTDERGGNKTGSVAVGVAQSQKPGK